MASVDDQGERHTEAVGATSSPTPPVDACKMRLNQQQQQMAVFRNRAISTMKTRNV